MGKGSRHPYGVNTDLIKELRAGAGVTIDGLRIKDAGLSGLVGGISNSVAAEAPTVGTASGLTLVDYSIGAIHKSVITLTALSQAVTDNGSTGSVGTKLITFPEGAVSFLGIACNLTAATTAAWAPTTPVASIGTATAAADATLTSTEADLIPSTALTIFDGATTFKVLGTAATRPVFDGSTTPKELYLNFACNSDPSTGKTVVWTGFVQVLWAFLGDLT